MKHKAGWIFNLDSIESLKRYIRDGVYATKIKPPKTKCWSGAYLGTLADYASMKEGQLVYFFIKKKIYGIGELVNIENTNTCVFDNFPSASLPQIPEEYINNSPEFYKKNLLYYEDNIWNNKIKGDTRYYQQRWICTFKPSPVFYDGIDMDDILKCDKSYRDLRGLRTFSGLTFIKLSPSENNIFQKHIEEHKPKKLNFEINYHNVHQHISKSYKTLYNLGVRGLLKYHENHKGIIQSEMLLEAYILYNFTRGCQDVENIFGQWDYFSHQITASPFKPREYMDKMDIAGYKGGINCFWKADTYLLIEVKKESAKQKDIEQVQKYIKWLRWEYGENIKIKSFLVAHSFNIDFCPDDVSLVSYFLSGDAVKFKREHT